MSSPVPVLSHTGCKELIWSPSGLPPELPKHKGASQWGLPPQLCSPHPAAPRG